MKNSKIELKYSLNNNKKSDNIKKRRMIEQKVEKWNKMSYDCETNLYKNIVVIYKI